VQKLIFKQKQTVLPMQKYKRQNGDYDSFIYTHIPKCGGTSFRALIYESALQSGINKSLLYIPGFGDLPNDKNFDQLNDDEKNELSQKKLKIIANHCKFDDHLHFNLKLEKPFYFTILRDPIKRFISHYNFFYKKLGYNKCKGVNLNELKEETLDFLLAKLANIQTNFIANVSKPKAVGDENIFKIAVYNILYNYGFVGILEEQEHLLKTLNKLAPEWLYVDGNMSTLNKNKDESKINKEILDKIAFHNRNDVNLYKFVYESIKI